jgi:hypothetical protein
MKKGFKEGVLEEARALYRRGAMGKPPNLDFIGAEIGVSELRLWP